MLRVSTQLADIDICERQKLIKKLYAKLKK